MKARLNRRDNDYWLHNESGETIASSWGVSGKKLSIKKCNEIFLSSVVDVEKLVEDDWDIYGEQFKNTPIWDYSEIFIAGFNKAMELNKDKVFTLDDMKEAYSRGFLQQGIISFNLLIQSIQQPTEIEVEIEQVNRLNIDKGIYEWQPKLDLEGCLILKKINL